MWQKMNWKDGMILEEIPNDKEIEIVELVIRGMSFNKAYQLIMGKIPQKLVDNVCGKIYRIV
jgi:hypothetical protein